MTRTWVVWAAAVLAAASRVAAQPAALEIDAAQSKVEFTLGDVLHTVHGTFQLRQGSFEFDPATGRMSGEIVVDAASGSSGNAARDRRMHANILESDRYPDIVFRPEWVEGKVMAKGTSQVQVHGMFRIHGVDHEMAVPVDVESNGRYAVTAHFLVPYVKWGMKNPSTLFLRVNDKVEIAIHAVARPRTTSAVTLK